MATVLSALTDTQRRVLTFMFVKDRGPDEIAHYLWGHDKGGRRYLTASRILMALRDKGFVGETTVAVMGRRIHHDDGPRPFTWVNRYNSYGLTEAGKQIVTANGQEANRD